MKSYLYGDVGNTIADFDRVVCVFADHFDIEKKEFKKSQYKVFVQIEPPEVHNMDRLFKIADKFDLILTWNKETLARCPNAVFFGWGSCWIPENEQKIHPKSKKLSIIASEKDYLEGHKLRHEVIGKFKDEMDVYGRKYKFVESKTTALNDYMFSVVIENVKHDNYFTEKIIDCLRTGTVPIYWGSENIGEFFDTNGFILFKNADEFEKILPTLTEEKYNSMIEYVKKNFDLAAPFAENYQNRLHRAIEEQIKKSNTRPWGFFERFSKSINAEIGEFSKPKEK